MKDDHSYSPHFRKEDSFEIGEETVSEEPKEKTFISPSVKGKSSDPVSAPTKQKSEPKEEEKVVKTELSEAKNDSPEKTAPPEEVKMEEPPVLAPSPPKEKAAEKETPVLGKEVITPVEEKQEISEPEEKSQAPEPVEKKSTAIASPFSPPPVDSETTRETTEEEKAKRYVPPANANKYSKYMGDPREKLIVCYECGESHSIIKHATSSLCPHCGTYISIKDHTINSLWNTSIKTRGDVTVGKKGLLRNLSVACNNLIIEGTFHSSVDCQNDLIIRTSGKITGYINCKRLIIERKAEIEIEHPITAEEVVIDGILTCPLIICSGQMSLKKKAKFIGDLQAKLMDIQEGAKHQGSMQLGW